MNLTNKVVYLLFKMSNSKFDISTEDFKVYRRYVDKLSIDTTNSHININVDCSKSRYINGLYLVKSNDMWELCANTKNKLFRDKFIMDKSSSLLSILDTLFNTNLILDSFDSRGIYIFENNTIKAKLANNEARTQNLPKSDIDDIFTIFHDLDYNAKLQSGFIIEFFGDDEFGSWSDCYCSNNELSKLIGFVITINKSNEVLDEIKHLEEKINILYPDYNNIRVFDNLKTPYFNTPNSRKIGSVINIIISKNYSKRLLEL